MTTYEWYLIKVLKNELREQGIFKTDDELIKEKLEEK